jgi:hypothetical protein
VTRGFGEKNLGEGSVRRHVSWRLVDQSSPEQLSVGGRVAALSDLPGHVFLALLPNLDVKQDKGVDSDTQVLLQAVIPALRRPSLGIERQTDGLSKVVQLETG